MLEVRSLTVHYGKALALDGVTLEVPAGTLTTVIGPNGAGKTTLLRAISGLVRLTAGDVMFLGRSLSRSPAHQIVRSGLVHCPEGRRPFAELSVHDNLILGEPRWPNRAAARSRLDDVLKLFPRLQERGSQLAGTLSGGEQQMLALGRALMCRPELLLLDEPSMGLAPMVVEEVFAAIRKIRRMGITVLLVEQNVETALTVCDDVAVLDHGRLTFRGSPVQLARDARLKEVYLGVA